MPEAAQVLPDLPEVIREKLAPIMERLRTEIHEAVLMGRTAQTYDLRSKAFARAQYGYHQRDNGYTRGQEHVMIAVLGNGDDRLGEQRLRELRAARIARRRAVRQDGTVDTETADLANEGGILLESDDMDHHQLPAVGQVAPAPIVPHDEDDDDEDDDDEDDDEHDPTETCCGCCTECGERHEGYDDDIYSIELRGGRYINVCTDCGHECRDLR